MLNRVRKGLLTIAAALLTVGVGAGTAHASGEAAAASSGQCKVEFTSLTATNLWHDGGEDWIWFVIDGSYYPGNTKSISFFQGTTQTAGTFGMPVKQFPSTGTATFQVVLDRTWPTANRVIDSNTVSCAAVGSGLSVRFSDGDATYDLQYKATLV
jgi:type 1 fimbria pilin